MAANRPWRCSICATEDQALRYPSGKMAKCLDCQKYYNISVNALKSKRTRTTAPKLEITADEFTAWIRAQKRECHYCGLAESEIASMGLKTSIGLPLQALGVDRVDGAIGYRSDNLVLCCYACNKAKGNVFSYDEMVEIGRAIGTVWARRRAS